ncbi:uncharacterized [Tachysurus ichikawai]
MHTGGTAVRPGGRSLKHSPSGRIMEEMRGQSRGPKVSHQPTSRHCPDMAALCVCAPGRKAWPQEGIKGGEEGRNYGSSFVTQESEWARIRCRIQRLQAVRQSGVKCRTGEEEVIYGLSMFHASETLLN